MARVHLAELEDQRWFPRSLRDAMTDFLSFLGNASPKPYLELARMVGDAMCRQGTTRVVDLCSGGGGPGITLARLLRGHVEAPSVVLTDLYPNRARFEALASGAPHHVTFESGPVDARSVPTALTGFRVIFNGFHHFKPEDAQAILGDAVTQRRGIAIYEMNGRSLPSLISILLSPVTLLLVTPLLGPFRVARLFWTYALPVLPLAVLWDGVVSCLRVYSPQELEKLVSGVPGGDAYDWQIGRLPIPGTPGKATYLVGTPRGGAGSPS